MLYVMIISWFASVLIGYYLFRSLAHAKLYFPSLPSFFFWFYTIIISFGNIIYYMEINPHYMRYDLYADQYTIQAHYLTLQFYLFFPLGMYVANCLFGYKPSQFERYLNEPILFEFGKNERIFVYLIALATFCLILLKFMTQGGLDGLQAKLSLLLLDPDIIGMLTEMRGLAPESAYITTKYMFGIPTYRINHFTESFYPVLSLSGLIYCHYIKHVLIKWFFYVNFMLLYFFQLGVGKASYLDLILMFVFLRIYMHPDRLKLKDMVKVGIVLITVGIGLYYFIVGVHDLLWSGILFFYRLCAVQVKGLSVVMKLIGTGHMDYLGKNILPNFIGMRGEVINLGFYLRETYFTFSGNLVSIFFADAYAGFGYWGAVLSMVFVGFVTQVFHIFFTRADKKRPIYIACYVFFIVGLVRGASISLSHVLSMKWLYLILFITVFRYMVRQSFYIVPKSVSIGRSNYAIAQHRGK